jgi:hypothetical protein
VAFGSHCHRDGGGLECIQVVGQTAVPEQAASPGLSFGWSFLPARVAGVLKHAHDSAVSYCIMSRSLRRGVARTATFTLLRPCCCRSRHSLVARPAQVRPRSAADEQKSGDRANTTALVVGQDERGHIGHFLLEPIRNSLLLATAQRGESLAHAVNARQPRYV